MTSIGTLHELGLAVEEAFEIPCEQPDTQCGLQAEWLRFPPCGCVRAVCTAHKRGSRPSIPTWLCGQCGAAGWKEQIRWEPIR